MTLGLIAKESKQTSNLGVFGEYSFVCADDTNRVWAVHVDEMNYKVIWFNHKSNKEEWLKCSDYTSYMDIYNQSK